MSNKDQKRKMKGQSFIELVIVMAVIVIMVGALVFATISSLRNAQLAQNQAQATKLAQEGLERVRTGRDRNQAISALGSVTSWNGDATGTGAIWNYQINGNCGNTKIAPPIFCYFNVSSQGILNYISASSTMPSSAEIIPPATMFRRAIILSDDSSFTTQKIATSIVTWTDFAGSHESRLTTILRKI